MKTWIVACALLALSVGCAHGKMGVVEQGLSKGSVASGETIYVAPITADAADFSGDKAGDSSRVGDEKSEVKSRYFRMVADSLRKKGFNAVTEPVKGGLVLTGQVTRFEHGSAAARILVGMGAGSSNMYTNFVLTNPTTHQTLSRFEIIATSGGNGGLQAAGGYINAHLVDGAAKAAEYIADANSGKK